MCAIRKQLPKAAFAIVAMAFTLDVSIAAEGDQISSGDKQVTLNGGSAGGVAIGDGSAGVTDRAWVTAPPNYLYVVEKERGSFLDCGEGQDVRAVDGDGRDMATLQCGVTLTETIRIPAAASSAKIIIHF